MVAFPNPRRRHPFHMHDMILGQPAFVAEALRRTAAADVSSFLRRPRRLVLTGCGTSFHAATYGARVLQEVLPSVPVGAVHAYDLAYGSSVPANATVFGVSHSGSTPTTNRALRRVRGRGCRTIAMCGLPDSPMERVADQTLVIGSTHDHSWANTMSYTTQLAAFAVLASSVKSHLAPSFESSLRGISRSLEKTLACESRIPARPDSAPSGASHPSTDPLDRADAVPRVLRGPRPAGEPGHHADGYSPTSCGSGGALSLTPTSCGTPTTVFASVPFRRSSWRSIFPLPYVIWKRSTSDLYRRAGLRRPSVTKPASEIRAREARRRIRR